MDFLWLIILVPLFNLLLVTGIALLAAVIAGKKEKRRKTFRNVLALFPGSF